MEASEANASGLSHKRIPPYLKPGDTIGICCPSGYISHEDIKPAIDKIQEWGFKVKVGNSVGQKYFTLGGTDDIRKEDFQNMLDDNAVNAILFGRGGYGAVRIIDNLNFKSFLKSPKWILGFSDATLFHTHLSTFRIASIHCKMCNSFPAEWAKAELTQQESIDSIRRCLVGEKLRYRSIVNNNNRQGVATGILIGGNLSLLENAIGTPSDFSTEGKLLFIEDVDEYLYNIDRMLWNLKRCGKLANIRGLIVGGFNKLKADDPGEDFGHTIYEIISEKVSEYNYPVCFDFPVGHQKNNVALKCGIKHRLIVTNNEISLEEI